MSEYISLNNGILKAEIHTLGAQLVRLCDAVTGKDYLWRGEHSEDEKIRTEWSYSAPVLFPICGRLKEGKYLHGDGEYSLPPHGFARFREFEPKSILKDFTSLSLSSDAETMAIYPFPFELSVSYRLVGKSLEITYSVKNSDEKEPMYFSFGSHEGYLCEKSSEHYSVEFPLDMSKPLMRYMLKEGIFCGERTETELDGGLLHIDYAELERCTYVFRNFKSKKVFFCEEDGKRILSVSCDGFDTLAVWSKRDSHFVCIEPWCGFPDIGENSDASKAGRLSEKYGIIKLPAGERKSMTHTVEIM